MASCFVTLDTGVVVDAFKQRAIGAAGPVKRGTHGMATYNASAFSAANTSDLNWTSGPFSVATWINVTGPENTFNILKREAYTNESSNQGWALQYRAAAAGSQGWNFLIENNNGINGAPGYGFGDGGAFATGDIMLGGRSDGSASKQVFRNGVQTATSAVGNFVPASSAGGMFYGSQNTSPTVTAYIYIACTWKRLLSASEFLQFYSDPWALINFGRLRRRSSTQATVAVTRSSTLSMMGCG